MRNVRPGWPDPRMFKALMCMGRATRPLPPPCRPAERAVRVPKAFTDAW